MGVIAEVRNQQKELVGYLVKSPATGEHVCYYIDKWNFNGNFEKPTFTPSMLAYGGPGRPREHFFVTDGKIQYLSDCEHEMAGMTVDMVDCH